MSGYEDQMRTLVLEARLERKTVMRHEGVSFYDVLRYNTKDVTYPTKDTVKDRKGKIIEVKDAIARGQDINHDGTLKKFFAHTKVNRADLISLYTDVEPNALALDRWLADEYTDRYKDEYMGFEGQKWRHVICVYTLEDVILENKVEGFLQKRKTFLDEDFAYFYAMIYKQRKMIKEVARTFQHIAKDKELFQEELDKFFARYAEEFRAIPLPQRTALLKAIERDEIEEQEERAREQETSHE